MHVPEFRLTHRLSQWPRCSLELHCCKGVHCFSTCSLLTRYGDMTFEELLPRFRCKRCHRFRPAPVYLRADRTFGGGKAEWKIELVPAIREKPRSTSAKQTAEKKGPEPRLSSWGGGFP